MIRRTRVLITALTLLCLCGTSFAHSVYIFAWADGTQICTESYFTQKSKVRGGEVKMIGVSGETLAQGVTAEDGVVCFPLPAKAQPLEFIVLAGAGHQGRFSLRENEWTVAVNATNEVVPASGETRQPTPLPFVEPNTTPSSSIAEIPQQSVSAPLLLDSTSEESLRTIVREELQKQLSPMRQYMAEKMEDKTPGIREIVGGIGWLIGLAALASWWSQRKKKA
ncbi:MAG: hypothetical protein ACRCWR_07400 [Saezia sp.]